MIDVLRQIIIRKYKVINNILIKMMIFLEFSMYNILFSLYLYSVLCLTVSYLLSVVVFSQSPFSLRAQATVAKSPFVVSSLFVCINSPRLQSSVLDKLHLSCCLFVCIFVLSISWLGAKSFFTMDITSLHTVMPNNEGLQALNYILN